MSGRVKIAIAAAVMLLVIATAPVMLCLVYVAQNTQSHSCCPPTPAPTSKILQSCCVQSPALTSQSVDVQSATAVTIASQTVESLSITAAIEPIENVNLYLSPPHCSSILRI